jgi:hypothetical protein
VKRTALAICLGIAVTRSESHSLAPGFDNRNFEEQPTQSSVEYASQDDRLCQCRALRPEKATPHHDWYDSMAGLK